MVPLPPLRDGARALPISSFRQSMPSFDTRCPGLHLQPGASVVLGCVGELPGSRCTDFNPRAPCGTRRERRQHRAPRPAISIHAPRVGRDRTMRKCGDTSRNFNPRAPCGARRSRSRSRLSLSKFQSTRPVWGATHRCRAGSQAHAISIHAPRVGRDVLYTAQTLTSAQFQSTRPVWDATRSASCTVCASSNFNPRAPCGTRPSERRNGRAGADISIHAPRVGRDYIDREAAIEICISIHAPRVGRDCILSIRKTLLSYFNPRAPCGTRRALVILVDCALQISIHAPRVGRDLASSAGAIVPERFQSTRPVWGATAPPSILAP